MTPLNYHALIDPIKERYNPEWDLNPPNCPPVTWAEYNLVTMVEHLEQRTTELEGVVKLLLASVQELENEVFQTNLPDAYKGGE